MIVFKDGSGYQETPATSPKPHLVADQTTADRIRAGDPWRLNTDATAVVFLSAAEIEAANLADAKAAAEPEIDSAAQSVRLAYVSPGKDATYQEKAAELARWIAAGRPDQAGGYRYMEAEAAARGVSLATVGAEIEAARNLWQQLDPQIEAISRAGKVAAQAATTSPAARNAITEAVTALEALKP